MENVLVSFNIEIKKIREYIQNTQLLNEEPIRRPLKVYLGSRKKKEFDYKSLIISLYGLLENHTEILIKSFLENIEKTVNDYNSLSDRIKKNHFTFSINLATLINQKKYLKYDHLSKEDVITNLNDCVINSNNYKINYDAFTLKTGNLKHVKVCELFQGIGIDLNNLLSQKDSFKKNSENKFNQIDNIVDLRNEIAHGNVNNILDYSEIIPIIDFFEIYFSEIHSITIAYLNNIVLEEKKKRDASNS